jgi:hypothetical protein
VTDLHLDWMKHRLLLPPSHWDWLEQLARRKGCSVNDLLLVAATIVEPDEILRLGRLARGLFLPLGQWPTDPIDALLVSWIISDCHVCP